MFDNKNKVSLHLFHILLRVSDATLVWLFQFFFNMTEQIKFTSLYPQYLTSTLMLTLKIWNSTQARHVTQWIEKNVKIEQSPCSLFSTYSDVYDWWFMAYNIFPAFDNEFFHENWSFSLNRNDSTRTGHVSCNVAIGFSVTWGPTGWLCSQT